AGEVVTAIPLILSFGAFLGGRPAPPPPPPPRREDTRTQYPAFLANSYFAVSLGSIHYGFSGRQLQPGFQAEAVDVPHAAARVALFGLRYSLPSLPSERVRAKRIA